MLFSRFALWFCCWSSRWLRREFLVAGGVLLAGPWLGAFLSPFGWWSLPLLCSLPCLAAFAGGCWLLRRRLLRGLRLFPCPRRWRGGLAWVPGFWSVWSWVPVSASRLPRFRRRWVVWRVVPAAVCPRSGAVLRFWVLAAPAPSR